MTDVGVRKLKPKAARYELWEDGRTGLGLRVSLRGRKTFVYMYWLNGKARRMTLGVYGEGPGLLTLADANVKRAAAKQALDQGRDPASENVDANQADREAESVADLVEAYMEKWARPRKRSADEDARILNKETSPERVLPTSSRTMPRWWWRRTRRRGRKRRLRFGPAITSSMSCAGYWPTRVATVQAGAI